MSYALSRNEDVVVAIRKAIAANLNEALQCLSISKGMSTEQFKKARKAVKRARAAIRLVEHGLKGRWVAREDEILRNVSRIFRDVRDLSVAQEVFNKVVKNSKENHSDFSFDSIKRRLEEICKAAEAGALKEEKKLRDAIADLQIASERVSELELKGDAWEAVSEGLRSTFRTCADSYEDTEATRSDSSYIQWRREVKFLRLQLDYLQDFLSSDMKEYNRNLHQLSDLLGDYQDMHMLQETIKEEKAAFGEKDTVRAALEMLEESMKQVGKEARTVGGELFDQTPKEFMKAVFDATRIPKSRDVA